MSGIPCITDVNISLASNRRISCNSRSMAINRVFLRRVRNKSHCVSYYFAAAHQATLDECSASDKS
jgi:hypothetical protein